MIKIALLGITAVLIVTLFKNTKQEYGTYISIAVSLIIISFVILKLEYIVNIINKYLEYLSIDREYVEILIKITGITYLAEFSVQICKDAGCGAIAGQIETAAKIIIVAMSIPILCTLIDTINNFCIHN